jgi:hypothetical protein
MTDPLEARIDPAWARALAPVEDRIRTMAQRDAPLVAILWGRDARSLIPVLADTPCVQSAHPSPMSASRGFFGSRPFSRANAALVDQGAAPRVPRRLTGDCPDAGSRSRPGPVRPMHSRPLPRVAVGGLSGRLLASRRKMDVARWWSRIVSVEPDQAHKGPG